MYCITHLTKLTRECINCMNSTSFLGYLSMNFIQLGMHVGANLGPASCNNSSNLNGGSKYADGEEWNNIDELINVLKPFQSKMPGEK